MKELQKLLEEKEKFKYMYLLNFAKKKHKEG